MSTINEALFDDMVRRQTYLSRYALGLRKRSWEPLAENTEWLMEKFLAALEQHDEKPWAAKWQPFLTVIRAIEEERERVWDEIEETWGKELPEVAEDSQNYLLGLLGGLLPFVFSPQRLPTSRITTIATKLTYDGSTVRRWLQRTRLNDSQRLSGALQSWLYDSRKGAARAALRAWVGTSAAKGTDGAAWATHKHLQSLARTLVHGVASYTLAEVVARNSAIFSEERFTAVLDAATTAQCRSLDGKLYKPGEGPVPPLHVGCRSTRIPVVKLPETRPATNTTENLLRKQFLAEKGVSRLTPALRGEFQTYMRERMKASIGSVPADTTYEQWLKMQTAAFQDEVLGKAKGKLFRDGGLSLSKFVARDGTELTLAELARTNATAFRRAGLDLEKYLGGNGAPSQ